ncbi:MAG: sensor histidine kinase [Gammaproteobacteria bacterium]|nr:sensor histidine kinase [Gammaproteobacteria bacterium]
MFKAFIRLTGGIVYSVQFLENNMKSIAVLLRKMVRIPAGLVSLAFVAIAGAASASESGTALPGDPMLSGMPKLPPGILAYAIAGAAIAFFFIAKTVSWEMVTGSTTLRNSADRYWRFYILFKSMMFVVAVQSIGFGYYAEAGFFSSLRNADVLALLIFAFGFVPMPIIWLDLIYTRNWAQLGFTRYYEDNFAEWRPHWMRKYYDCIDAGREKPGNFRNHFWETAFCKAYSFITWLLIYLISPISLVHLRSDFRNPAFANNAGKWLQAGQDALAVVTAVIFLACIFFAALQTVFPAVSYYFWAAIVLFPVLVLSALLLGFAPLRLLPMVGATKPITVLLLFIYSMILLLDLFAGKIFKDFYALAGGYTPWILLSLIMWVTHIFMTELKRARSTAVKVMKEGVRTNFADRALHHFGNCLQAPTSILVSVQQEIFDAEALKKLAGEPKRLNILLRRIGNARVALSDAQQLINDMKSEARAARKPQWLKPAKLLAMLQGPVDIGKNRQVSPEMTFERDEIELNVEKRMFQQIIQNLLDNAVSAIRSQPPREPRIEIKTVYQQDDAYPLSIIIFDNGSGIQSKVRERIYDAYFSTKGAGSGLGLYLAWKFMEDLGGEIQVDTRTGSDSQTKFTLRFPKRSIRIGPNSGQAAGKIMS